MESRKIRGVWGGVACKPCAVVARPVSLESSGLSKPVVEKDHPNNRLARTDSLRARTTRHGRE